MFKINVSKRWLRAWQGQDETEEEDKDEPGQQFAPDVVIQLYLCWTVGQLLDFRPVPLLPAASVTLCEIT